MPEGAMQNTSHASTMRLLVSALLLMVLCCSPAWSQAPSDRNLSASTTASQPSRSTFWEWRLCVPHNPEQMVEAQKQINAMETALREQAEKRFRSTSDPDLKLEPIKDEWEIGRYVPTHITNTMGTWLSIFARWNIAHFSLLILSVAGSSIAAANAFSERHKRLTAIFAIMATISTSTLGVIAPKAYADRHLDGWLHLKKALSVYQSDARMTTCDLVNAYIEAEEIIHRTRSATPADPVPAKTNQ